MAGKYSDSPTLDVYLKSHSGDEIRVDRKGRPAERITDPALTIGLAVQPHIIDELGNKPYMRGTGLLARFLYSTPVTRQGTREVSLDAESAASYAAYRTAFRAAMFVRSSGNVTVIKPGLEAMLAWKKYAEEIETKLVQYGEYDSIRDWAGKLPGACLRIFGILRMLDLKTNYDQRDNLRVMESAISISRYLAKHAFAALGALGRDEVSRGAEAILKLVRRKKWTTFTAHELQQAIRGQQRFKRDGFSALRPSIDLLIEYGHLRESIHRNPGARGRPSSSSFTVHPCHLNQ